MKTRASAAAAAAAAAATADRDAAYALLIEAFRPPPHIETMDSLQDVKHRFVMAIFEAVAEETDNKSQLKRIVEAIARRLPDYE